MSANELEKLVVDFESKTEEVKKCLLSAVEIVSKGKILGNELETEINTSFEELNSKYDCIKKQVEDLVGEEQMPSEIIPVREFIGIVSENEKKLYKDKLIQAEYILNTFLQIRSAIDGYAKAIKPLQDEVGEKVRQRANNKLGDEETIEAAHVPGLFIEAITMEDIDSEKGMNLLDQIGEVYPNRVMAGVAAGKYYIEPSDSEITAGRMTEEAINEESEVLNVEETVETVEEISQESGEEITRSEEKESTPGSIPEDDTKNEPEETVEGAMDDTIEAINNPKKGTPSASSFKKDFKAFPNAVCMILPMFTNFGMLTEKQVYQIGICADAIDDEKGDAKEGLGPLLEKLALKGWLAKYEIEKDVFAYALSEFVYRTLMEKGSIRSGSGIKWMFSFGSYNFLTEKVMSRKKVLHAYHNNGALIDYLMAVRQTADKDSFEKIMSSIKWEDDHYNVSVFVNSKMDATKLIIDPAGVESESFLWVLNQDENIDELTVGNTVKTVYLLENNVVVSYEPIEGIIKLKKEKDIEEFLEVQEPEKTEILDEEVIEDTQKDENVSESLEDEMRALTDVHRAMNDSELRDYAIELLNPEVIDDNSSEMVANATLLMKAASMEDGNKGCRELYRQLIYATGNPIGEANYSYTSMSEVFIFDTPDVLALSAQMLAMIIPGMAYDHALHGYSERFLTDFDTLFPSCNCVKGLFNQLNRIWGIAPNGYTPSVMALLGNDQENQKFADNIKNQAKLLMTVPSVKTRMNTLPIMYNACFGPNSDFYACMEIIVENRMQDIDLVKSILEDYCDVVDGQYNLNTSKTEGILDTKWNEANPGNYFTLEYDARPQALKHFYSRINLMKTWVEHTESLGGKNIDLSKLKTLRDEIIKETEKAISHFSEVNIENGSVLYITITNIKKYLSGEKLESPYKKALYTGRISLDENNLPIIDETTAGIKYCEPWRFVIKHIELELLTKEEVIDQVNDRDSLIFDNLNQLERLGKSIGTDSEEFFVPESRLKKAITSADARTTKFRERLELAYTYDQINENDKETLAAIVEQQKDRFYSIKDFGCWRQFLEGLERQIIESALKGKRELKEKIQDRLRKDPESSILIEADKLLERDTNLAVTEEYLNRYDAGEKEISIEMENFLAPRNEFATFLSDEVYGPLLEFGKQKSNVALKNSGWSFISGRLPADWTSRLRDDSKRLIEAWPARKGANEAKIRTLFEGLGLPVDGIKPIRDSKEEMFRLELNASPRSKADYPHPIAAFGTQIKRNMNVIVLYGTHTPSQIVETVSKIDSKGFSIVLIDRALERVTRRQIGELSHQKSGQNPFILIDWVLILHLAMQDNTNRLPILLACTLPYTTYQPFVRDGGPTADEMFCGRTKELNTIMDRNGASVVYGGRQLGKTALLERAESRCHRPENKEFAVFCSIINKKTEKEVAEHILDAINKKTSFGLKPASTLKDMCSQIESLFRNGKVASFLLLLDECDDFLGAIADNSYQQIQEMINLKRSTKNAFKFVLAGLHNVCRAKNSTERNGVFGQLGEPLCVRPLQPSEALQLLSRPLCYQGFQIDPYPHLKTILTKTNYYPGILQFFGYKLLETLTDQYSKYYSAANGNPPFTLKDEQLGAVLSSADLNNSIKAKFRWSLELDQRYLMIARCITMLYYFEQEERMGNWKGFSISQIMEMANGYDIHCLINMSVPEYKNLLDEMVDMGILSKTEGDAYRLRRSSFIGIIGADIDSLDKDIMENNKEVTA